MGLIMYLIFFSNIRLSKIFSYSGKNLVFSPRIVLINAINSAPLGLHMAPKRCPISDDLRSVDDECS